jgi:transposase
MSFLRHEETPKAKQVADRFHLVQNLRETVAAPCQGSAMNAGLPEPLTCPRR